MNVFLVVWTVLVTLVAYGIAGTIYYRRGVTRGREMERMEPPPKGAMHFRDGVVTHVLALDASDAIEQLRQHAERSVMRTQYFRMGGWD